MAATHIRRAYKMMCESTTHNNQQFTLNTANICAWNIGRRKKKMSTENLYMRQDMFLKATKSKGNYLYLSVVFVVVV